jgi:hypothetical protein
LDIPRFAEVRVVAAAVAEALVAGAVVDQWLLGHRAGVGQGLALRGVGLRGVREALAVVDGEHRLGVVALAEGLPDLGALGHAVLGLGGQQRDGVVDLAAASGAEERADDGSQRDQVGDLEVVDGAGVGDGVLVAGQDVLTGEVAAAVGGVDVGVDAVDVGVGVGEGLLTAGAVVRDGVVDLGLQIGLGVGRVAPELLLQALVGGGPAGEGGQLAAADVPEDVHQPQPVLGGGVPGAVLGAVAGGAGDVRHTGLLVADDRHVGASAGRGGGGDLVGGDPEGRVVEEVVDLGVGERGGARGQVAVGAELVLGVVGLDAEGLVEEDLGEGGVAVLTGREDVGTLAAAVVVGGERGRAVGGRRLGQRGQQGGYESTDGSRPQELGESAGSSLSVECGAWGAPWHGCSYRRGWAGRYRRYPRVGR